MMALWYWLTGTGPIAEDRTAARAALNHARESFDVAESRTEEITTLARTLREQGIQNHFVERLNMHVAKGNHAHGL